MNEKSMINSVATCTAHDENDAGFTLLELLVVLIILAMLAAIATPQVMKYLGRAKTDTAHIQTDALASALELFYLDNGRYPSDDEGLKALVTAPQAAPSWNGPYIKQNTSLIDPWGNPYIYHGPNGQGEVQVVSLGKDKAEGGTGEAQDVTATR